MLTIIFSSNGNETPTIDYELVSTKGEEKKAQITNIETEYNTTINGVHPATISYTYIENERAVNSKYRALEESKIEDWRIGREIEIKEFEGKSIIKGLEPFEFPVAPFLLPPVLFLLIGIPFLIYSLSHLRKELGLYKFGEVKQGQIVSMIPKSGLPISNIGLGVIVHYEYEINGRKTMGESLTNDLSILNDKRKGDFVPIFVSTDNLEKSCLVPKLESLRNDWKIEFED